MRIVWTGLALADLAALRDFVSNDNPEAADALVRRIVDLVERQLSRLPDSGRPGRVARTRELVIVGSPYFVPYRVVAGSVEVLRVIHGARRWPDKE